MTNFYHQNDLPDNLSFNSDIAIDTEAMGLNNLRDRLCVVQICDGSNDAHIVHMTDLSYNCPNLKKLLADKARKKIFHFARFDVAILEHYLKIRIENIFCTKIASKLCRTYTDQHGLRNLCYDLLGVKINKQERSSDWGGIALTKEQIDYAASDVLHLHKVRDILYDMLVRENRADLAAACFEFLPSRARLDLLGWNSDIFEH